MGVYEQLKSSSVENIYVVGRRGPLAFKGTRKELKELRERPSDMANISVLDDFYDIDDHDATVDKSIFVDDVELDKMKRAARKDLTKRGSFRTYAYLRDVPRCDKNSATKPINKDYQPKNDYQRSDNDDAYEKYLAKKPRHCQFRFHRTPAKITENSIHLKVTHPAAGDQTTEEILPADLIVICTGNKTSGWDNIVEYSKNGIADFSNNFNDQKIDQRTAHFQHPKYKNVLFGGWARTGSKGVVNDSMDEAHILSKVMLKNIEKIDPANRTLDNQFQDFVKGNEEKDRITNWEEWQHVREWETKYGHYYGRYRTKVTGFDDFKEKVKAEIPD